MVLVHKQYAIIPGGAVVDTPGGSVVTPGTGGPVVDGTSANSNNGARKATITTPHSTVQKSRQHTDVYASVDI